MSKRQGLGKRWKQFFVTYFSRFAQISTPKLLVSDFLHCTRPIRKGQSHAKGTNKQTVYCIQCGLRTDTRIHTTGSWKIAWREKNIWTPIFALPVRKFLQRGRPRSG
ncbi:conserved hypothetical protein [Trichinella spiralis]|uniref:hypothetical protein n=1 Tax=Trichinella spiralis TaxID=6334 RepID=UPI0001EFB39B|nr:conserved hypothetical protein [Trichinella spiralis]